MTDKKSNLENKEVKLDVILIGKHRVLDISKNRSLETKQKEEEGSKESKNLEPIQRKDKEFRGKEDFNMLDIVKGIEYYGKTTKFKNFR